MVASNARRSASRRSGGTPGVVKKGRAHLGRVHDRAQDLALLVGAGQLDRGRQVGKLLVSLERELHQQRDVLVLDPGGMATFTAVHEVEWPSTSPRSTASMASFDPR